MLVGLEDAVKFTRNVKENGFLEAVRSAERALVDRIQLSIDRRFDRKFGVDTCGVTQLSDLTIGSQNRNLGAEYTGTPVTMCRTTFSKLPQDLAEFVFIDLGSGKGRVLLLASEYNFKRIIGIEFATELHIVAERNISSYKNKKQKCFDITAKCMDALDFRLPDEKCVIYIFSPFKFELASKIWSNIERSYRENPRKMYIVYAHTFFHTLMDESDFLKIIGTGHSGWNYFTASRYNYVIYESIDN